MTGPLINLGVTNEDIQNFVLTYASAWAQVPGRLMRVQQLAQSATASPARDNVLASVSSTQDAYASISTAVGETITAFQSGSGVDITTAAQAIPEAMAVMGATDSLEASVGINPGVKVTTRVPWTWYLILAIPLYLLLRPKKKGR